MITLWLCGLFYRCPSTRYRTSNELSSFIAIIPATLLFYANVAATNLALVGVEIECFPFFRSAHKQEPELSLSE